MGYPSRTFPNPPARQLSEAIERAKRPHEKLIDVARRAGISDRTRREWVTEARTTVQFNMADRVLTRLGLEWWDVWTEANTSPDELARVEFAFTGEHPDQPQMDLAA